MKQHVGGVQLPLFTPESGWTAPTELPELHGAQAWDLETHDPNLSEMGPGWIPGGEGRIAGFAVCADNFSGYFPIAHEGGGCLDPGLVKRWVRGQIKKPVPKIFANAPYDIGWMAGSDIIIRPDDIHDVQLQGPLIDENRYSYGLDKLATDYLGYGKENVLLREALASYGLKDMGKIAQLPPAYVGPYATRDAVATRDLWLRFNEIIAEEDLHQVYNLERSLIPLMIAMRMRGMPVNVSKAEKLYDDMKRMQKDILAEIKRLTGIKVDPWIAPTIASALETQGITCPRTPKTNQPSVTATWLEEIDNPIARMIHKVRQYDKAAGTFIQNYVLNYARNGRIHAQFNQLRSDPDDKTSSRTAAKGTVSGRFSSDTPNLQNIPTRDPDIGWRIRDLFIPEKGELWASADYSSQEPRLTVHFAALAMLRGAQAAVDRYLENARTDYHQMVADICSIPRKQAKAINLGIAYGMGGPKLCRELGLPTEWIEVPDRRNPGEMRTIEVAGPEGQDILNRVNENAPFIKELFDLCVRRANSRGYIRTLLGRRCRFEMRDGKAQWTHKALNRLIQGSAADQTKEAMRQLFYDHDVVPLATVHDELCFSVPDAETARKFTIVMENAVQLEIPVVADIKMGESWGTAKELTHG